MFKVFEKKEPQNLEEVLNSFNELKKRFDKLSQELENLKKDNKLCVKKVGMVRFNPFQGVGGDQSFSIALLDGEDAGVVITSLYNQDGNRIYAKPIKSGQSAYTLSKEEKDAIEKAIAGKDSEEKSNDGKK